LFFHEWEYIYFLRRVMVQGSKFWFSVQALFRKTATKLQISLHISTKSVKEFQILFQAYSMHLKYYL
jgi:hypothetical protein